MEDFVKFLIVPLLSQPDQLQIEISGGLVFATVSNLDIGHVIGKNGSVISAIRTLLKCYCLNHRLAPTGITVRSITDENTSQA